MYYEIRSEFFDENGNRLIVPTAIAVTFPAAITLALDNETLFSKFLHYKVGNRYSSIGKVI